MTDSDFQDRLERLHGSRKRAEKRAEREKENRGVFSADDAVEHEEPPGERDSGDETTATPDESNPEAEPTGDTADPERDVDEHEPTGDSRTEMTYRRAEPPSDDDTAADDTPTERPSTEVGERLARSHSLRNRSSRGESTASEDSTSATTDTPESQSAATSDVSRETDRGTITDDPSLPPNERAEMLRKRAEDHLDDGDWHTALPILHEIVALLPRHAFALEKLAKFHRDNGDHQLADHYESRLRDVSPF